MGGSFYSSNDLYEYFQKHSLLGNLISLGLRQKRYIFRFYEKNLHKVLYQIDCSYDNGKCVAHSRKRLSYLFGYQIQYMLVNKPSFFDEYEPKSRDSIKNTEFRHRQEILIGNISINSNI